jgi:hypothetical protein
MIFILFLKPATKRNKLLSILDLLYIYMYCISPADPPMLRANKGRKPDGPLFLFSRGGNEGTSDSFSTNFRLLSTLYWRYGHFRILRSKKASQTVVFA